MSQAIGIQLYRNRKLTNLLYVGARAMSGEPGSGVGKGGGAGGVIREAGGSFGKKEAAQEEQYVRKLQQEQLKALKKGMEKEIEFHKDQIEAHEDALKRHQERLNELFKPAQPKK